MREVYSMSVYPNLFRPGKIGVYEVKNRIVMSPMGENFANADGSVSDQSVAYFTERAKGGTGIIIPGVFSVEYPRGKTITYQHRIDEFKYITGLKRLADSVHRHDTLLLPQLHHAGGQTNSVTTEGVTPICVSDSDEIEHLFIRGNRAAGPQQEMTIEDIYAIRDKFIQSAIYCAEARCDGVELHAAHGYLISAFFSNDTNKRTDEYGGSLENRMRFAIEIIEGIRKACGSNFIIGARMPGVEWAKNGLSAEDCLTIAKSLEAAGCNFLDVSGGVSDKVGNLLEPQTRAQGDRVNYAAPIKKAVSIPVMTVGALREPEFCERVLAEGKADYILMGRQLICDPYWVNKAKSGRENEIRKCISCMDGCSDNNNFGRPITCTLNPAVGFEREFSRLPKAESTRNVLVIGGGPAGMEAATTAASIGHNVTLLEANSELGGQLNLACIPPDKQMIQWANDWLTGEVGRQKVNVHLNCEADMDTVKSLNPDYVLFASGATPCYPSIPGVDYGVCSWDIITGKQQMPHKQNVAIVGGGIVACEVAGMLIENENTVTIIEMLPSVAMNMEGTNREEMLEKLMTRNLSIKTNSIVTEITQQSVKYKIDCREEEILADMVLISVGQKPAYIELYNQIVDAGYKIRRIGDVKRPSKILDAVNQGFFAALDID